MGNDLSKPMKPKTETAIYDRGWWCTNARAVRKQLITSRQSANADRKLIGQKKLKGNYKAGRSVKME